ncbi:Uncharacterized protein QTN25_004636 [Entamoeba marina]
MTDFEDQVLKKKPVLTETLGRIINLEFQQENINIRNLTDTLCSMKYDVKEKEELKQKTLRRRYDKNKLIFIHNFIIDILVEKNYFFNFKLSKKSHKTLQFERIQEVFYKDKLLWNKDQLLLHGKLICKHISSQLNCNKDIVIHQNNNVIQNLLFKSPNINTLF